MSWNLRFLLHRIANVVLGAIILLLGLRIALRFFGANPQTPLVSWIYGVSDGLIYPFTGIFPNAGADVGLVIDVTALVAIVAYSIIGYLVMAIIDALTSPSDAVVEHRHVA